MQKFFFTFALLAFSLTVSAQNFTVSGNVINQSGTSVDFADVLLYADTKLVQNTMTDEQGKFTISAPAGSYHLLIWQLGDTLFSQTFVLDKNIDLGTINAKQQDKQLQEVTVVGQKPLVVRKVDRLVFNVENSIAATGGDATDALKVWYYDHTYFFDKSTDDLNTYFICETFSDFLKMVETTELRNE